MRKLCFSFLCTADGVNPGLYHTDTNVRDVDRAMTTAGIDTDYREGEAALDHTDYAEVFEHFAGDEFAITQGQGIVEARDFLNMVSDIGAIFQDVQTMGTLGGPLGGLAPDFDYMHESTLVILSLRATPVLRDEAGGLHALTEASWERMRTILRDVDPWSAARGNLARDLSHAQARRQPFAR